MEQSMMLVNVTELIVREKVREIMDTIDTCQCETCFVNACAIALNSLPSYYVTTDKGTLLTLLDTINIEYQTDLVVKVTEAIKKVKGEPHHF